MPPGTVPGYRLFRPFGTRGLATGLGYGLVSEAKGRRILGLARHTVMGVWFKFGDMIVLKTVIWVGRPGACHVLQR
jgi:hypothetical protein